MTSIYKFYKESDFAKGVVALMTGTTIVQAISVLVSPILTRLYSPGDFGIFATYTAIITILGNFISGRYELGIVLPKSQNRALDLRRLCSVLGFCITLLILILIIFNRGIVAEYVRFDNYLFLLFIPIGIFIFNEIVINSYWKIRNNAFQLLSIARISQSLSSSFYQVLSGYFFYSTYLGLMIGQLLGQSVGLIILKREKRLNYSKRYFKVIRLLAVARRFIDFPKKMLPAGIINTLTPHVPIFIFGYFYSSETVGFFSLSQRVIQTPMSIIGNSVADVFLKKASVLLKTNPKRLKKLSVYISISLFLLGLIPMIILIFYSPALFKFLFGNKWINTGKFVQVMAGYLCFQFAFSPLCRLFTVLERQGLYQIWEWIRFILVSTGIIIGSIYFEPIYAIAFFTLSMIISYIILAFLSFSILNSFIIKKDRTNNND